MEAITENISLCMSSWFSVLLIVLIVIIAVISFVIPLIPYYQRASIREISELKIYSVNNQMAQKLLDSTLNNDPNLTKLQARELQLHLMEHVEPQKYKQYLDEEELKRIALLFTPIF